jgi:hypothetical protein
MGYLSLPKVRASDAGKLALERLNILSRRRVATVFATLTENTAG